MAIPLFDELEEELKGSFSDPNPDVCRTSRKRSRQYQSRRLARLSTSSSESGSLFAGVLRDSPPRPYTQAPAEFPSRNRKNAIQRFPPPAPGKQPLGPPKKIADLRDDVSLGGSADPIISVVRSRKKYSDIRPDRNSKSSSTTPRARSKPPPGSSRNKKSWKNSKCPPPPGQRWSVRSREEGGEKDIKAISTNYVHDISADDWRRAISGLRIDDLALRPSRIKSKGVKRSNTCFPRPPPPPVELPRTSMPVLHPACKPYLQDSATAPFTFREIDQGKRDSETTLSPRHWARHFSSTQTSSARDSQISTFYSTKNKVPVRVKASKRKGASVPILPSSKKLTQKDRDLISSVIVKRADSDPFSDSYIPTTYNKSVAKKLGLTSSGNLVEFKPFDVGRVLKAGVLQALFSSIDRYQKHELLSLDDLQFPSEESKGVELIGYSVPRYHGVVNDYWPYCFYWLRRHSHLKDTELIKTLSSGDLTAEESRGKSGAMFLYSADKTVIFKQLRYFEFKSLNSMLDSYLSHINKHPSTFLCRILGCYMAHNQRSGQNHYYVCLKALFSMDNVDKVYDLKGSTYKRTAKRTKMSKKVVRKDLDAINEKFKICLGRQLRTTLDLQLKADANFLKDHTIIDYSFVVGVLTVPEADQKEEHKDISSKDYEVRKVVFVGKKHRGPHWTDSEWNKMKRLQVSNLMASTKKSRSKQRPLLQDKYHSIFCSSKEHGGIMARNLDGKIIPGAIVYFIGIIDYLQPYNTLKKMETGVKGIVHDKKTISCVHPDFYCERFLRFVLNFVE